VRRDAAVFDTSHMLALDVDGAGARAFLRHALANDAARLRLPRAGADARLILVKPRLCRQVII